MAKTPCSKVMALRPWKKVVSIQRARFHLKIAGKQMLLVAVEISMFRNNLHVINIIVHCKATVGPMPNETNISSTASRAIHRGMNGMLLYIVTWCQQLSTTLR